MLFSFQFLFIFNTRVIYLFCYFERSHHPLPCLVIVDTWKYDQFQIRTEHGTWWTFLQFKEFVSFVKNVQTPKLYPKLTFLSISASDYWRTAKILGPPTSLIIGHCLYYNTILCVVCIHAYCVGLTSWKCSRFNLFSDLSIYLFILYCIFKQFNNDWNINRSFFREKEDV